MTVKRGEASYNAAQWAERDARYIEDSTKDELWKKEYEDHSQVLFLEKIFLFIENGMESCIKVDNELHLKAAEKHDETKLNEWYKAFNHLLTAAQKAIHVIERSAKRLEAGRYTNPVLTLERIKLLKDRIEKGLEAIKEWNSWEPPTIPRS